MKNSKSTDCLTLWLATDAKLVRLGSALRAAGMRAAAREIEAVRTALARSVERVQDKAYAAVVRERGA